MIIIGLMGAAWYDFNLLIKMLVVCWGNYLLQLSCSVRVANELGRGDAKATKFSIKVLLTTSSVIGLFFWILCLVFGAKIGYLFTNEDEVVQSISDLSLLLAFTVLLGSIFPVLSGYKLT